MIVLGITGGVGSGKSRVLLLLQEKYKAYILEADKLAHQLMEPGETIYKKIVDCFGECILDDDKKIDRKKLGNIVFNDNEKLEKLNNLVHPSVKDKILSLIEEQRIMGTELFVIEAALLIETGYKEICDYMWYIFVSKDIRIERLIQSRGYTVEKCESIINNQMTDSFYFDNTDCTIINDKSFDFTSKQINEELNKILQNDII